MHYLDESHILLFLLQLLILIGCTRGLGELFRRWKQPAITAEILVGVLLGPTIMGRFMPGIQNALFPQDPIQQSMLETISWLGVLFLLLDTGLEIDFSIAWRQRTNALVIAVADIIIPMVIAFAAVVFLPSTYMVDPERRIIFSLFMATVMTISAMPVAARVLHDLKLLKADLGFLVMSALAVNDIIGWVIFTIILGIFTGGQLSLGSIALVFAVTVGFAAMALTLARNFSTRLFNAIANRNFPEPSTSLTITVLLGLFFGAITQKLGIHALFGFFIAGVVIGEAKSLSEKTRTVMSQMVHSLFVPLFFANIGLKMDFARNFDPFLVTLVCVVGIAGRYAGAWIGVTLTSAPRVNRDLISIAHTPGGMMEVVLALVAMEAGIITPTVFIAIVCSAVLSSAIAGPLMSRSLSRRKRVSPSDFLDPECIIANMNADSRTSAIEELASTLSMIAQNANPEAIVKMAMSREMELGTAIGRGIAIPHARIDGLKNPVLAFGRSEGGIDWNAPDGRPVHYIFLLATPSATEDIHVQILASIARAVESPGNREKLKDAPDKTVLLQTLKSMWPRKAVED